MTDTVPAMLTPGEFIMSRGAVQRHGVGVMSQLNRGKMPQGFNKGGPVGGTQYLAEGGPVGALETLLKAIQSIGNITMTHNVNVNGSLTINGSDVTANVKNSIAEMLSDYVVGQITGLIKGFRNRNGGEDTGR